jgi:hydrogenase expression/formation protein HypE
LAEPLDFESWTCPLPLRDHERIVIGHGGGGRLSAELVNHLILPAFGAEPGAVAHDAATLDRPAGRLAYSTDAYVVQPLFFPGGSIGDLAVNGTVNDVAMAGAVPLALSCAFILEEGLPLEVLGRVVADMGRAADRAGVRIVTGDTKVVDVGHADGLFVTTSGVGVIPEGVDIRPDRAAPGDVVIVSGPIGLHGIAVMSRREGLEFGTEIRSDSAPLAGLVQTMLAAHRQIHVLRDPTRGGLAATLCEIAESARCGIEYEEAAVPVPAEVAAACAILGLDAVSIANEGKLVAVVPPAAADDVLAAMTAHPDGRQAVVIGRVVADHPGVVVARTPFGARRILDLPLGEQLPRIC